MGAVRPRGGVALGIERGIEKGIDKGRQEGRQQGEAEALLRLLEAKFGLLPAALTARVRAASTDQLERWLPRVLTAVSLDQVLGSA